MLLIIWLTEEQSVHESPEKNNIVNHAEELLTIEREA